MNSSCIEVRGARQHNLRNVDVDIPRDRLVVITGVSGSGKSSLAFDTVYAEGQRRYLESLSSYARQFLGAPDKPDLDSIEGLSPAIAIDQKGLSRNPRSTVGTATEIYDCLRLLFARAGQPHCVSCGRPVSRSTPQQIVDAVRADCAGQSVYLLAPRSRGRRGEHREILTAARREGYVRARIDGALARLDDESALALDRRKQHDIDIVVDRLTIRAEDQDDDPERLVESVETALRAGEGALLVAPANGAGAEKIYSEHFACAYCGDAMMEVEPRNFSFNSVSGACPECAGLGHHMEPDPDLVIPDPGRSLADGAVATWREENAGGYWRSASRYASALAAALGRALNFSEHTPVEQLPAETLQAILYGMPGGLSVEIRRDAAGRGTRDYRWRTNYRGALNDLRIRYKEMTPAQRSRSEIERYFTTSRCRECAGSRLRPEARATLICGRNIAAVSGMTIRDAIGWFRRIAGDGEDGGAGNRRRRGAVAPAAADRRAGHPGDPQPSGRSPGHRTGLSDPGPRRVYAVGRGSPARAAGDPDRQPARRSAVRMRRAHGGTAPRGRPAAHRHPPAAAGPGQFGGGRGA